MTIKIGDSLREARKIKGLTMKDLAQRVGTSLEYIHELETGKANPSMAMLKKLTDELELSVTIEPKKDEVIKKCSTAQLLKKRSRPCSTFWSRESLRRFDMNLKRQRRPRRPPTGQ